MIEKRKENSPSCSFEHRQEGRTVETGFRVLPLGTHRARKSCETPPPCWLLVVVSNRGPTRNTAACFRSVSSQLKMHTESILDHRTTANSCQFTCSRSSWQEVRREHGEGESGGFSNSYIDITLTRGGCMQTMQRVLEEI